VARLLFRQPRLRRPGRRPLSPTQPDQATARKLAQALNQGGIDIAGHIEALQVEHRTGEVIRQIAEIPLGKGGLFG
jgi:hypothetical protein